MREKDWQPRRKIEADYFASVRDIVKQALKGERADVIGASDFVRKYAWQAAQRMITGLYFDGARTWRAAARESMRGGQIYELLRAELQGPMGVRVRQLIAHNARLISSLPLEISEKVNTKIAEHALEGSRAENFASSLMSHLTRSRAHLIARTETSKVSTALTQARSEDLGLDWFVWQTSKDSRVRLSHRKMQGVLINWRDLPSPEALSGEKSVGRYAAGNVFNCRCYPEPVLYLDQVRWPHMVFVRGTLRSMTRVQFTNLSGIQIQSEAA
jgi:SPP1 gp7 family putative phage head morphogenesis protein